MFRSLFISIGPNPEFKLTIFPSTPENEIVDPGVAAAITFRSEPGPESAVLVTVFAIAEEKNRREQPRMVLS